MAAPSAGTRHIAYVEVARYDEAVFRMNVRHSGEGPPAAGGAGAQLALLPVTDETVKEGGPAKVFQHEGSWATLTATAVGDRTDYHLVYSEVANSVLLLQRGTADAYAQAIAASAPTRTPPTNAFRFRARVVTSDRLAAQRCAERSVAAQRGRITELFIGCEAHKSVSCAVKAINLLDEGVTGVIRTACCLKTGSWMRSFRMCLREEISTTLVVLEGVSSPAAERYRKQAIMSFASSGQRRARRREQVLPPSLLNGDWELRDVCQVYVRPGRAWDRETIAKTVAHGMTLGACKKGVRVLNRGRWDGNERAIGQLALLEACHGLLSRTMRRWLVLVGFAQVFGPGRPPADAGAPARAIIDQGDHPAEADGGADGSDQEAAAGDEQVMAPVPVAPGDAGGQPEQAEPDPYNAAPDDANVAAPPPGANWAEYNGKNRRLASQWLYGGGEHVPLRDLVILRYTIEPAMKVLRKQLWYGGDRYLKKLFVDGIDGNADTIRGTRLMLSARGVLDLQYARHIEKLLKDAEIWRLLPFPAVTEATKCQIFRMIARSSGEYERLLGAPHRRLPFRLFLAAVDVEVARSLKVLLAERPCCVDEFTTVFAGTFDLESEEARYALVMILLAAKVETSRIECWHASLRRLCVRLGAQTHPLGAKDGAARTLCRRVKQHEDFFRPWVPRPPAAKAKAKPAPGPPPAKRRRRGGGGAWRAFVSRCWKFGEWDMTRIAQMYRARGPAEVARDEEEGRRGTDRHRHGAAAFTERDAAQETRATTAAAEVHRRRHPDMEQSFIDAPHSASAGSMDVSTAGELAVALKVLDRADALATKEEAAAEVALTEHAAKFVADHGGTLLDNVLAALPRLRPHARLLAPLPMRLVGANTTVSLTAVCLDASAVATKAVAAAQCHPVARKSSQGLAKCLDVLWAARVLPIYDGEWTGPPIGGEPGLRRCFVYGHCVCSAEGKRMWSFRNSFYRALKLRTRRKTVERRKMREGFYVVRLRGRPHAPPPLVGVDAFFADAAEEWEPSLVTDAYHFWHLSSVLLTPYEITAQDMVLGDEEAGLLAIVDGTELSLEAPCLQ